MINGATGLAPFAFRMPLPKLETPANYAAFWWIEQSRADVELATKPQIK